MTPLLLTRLSDRCAGAVLALVVALTLPATHASTDSCRSGNQRDLNYLRRPDMDRCEGIRPTKDIAATGLRLTSFTIGQPTPVKNSLGGQVFLLQIPASSPGSPDPRVLVQAWKGNYMMAPLRFSAASQGWKQFSWGVAVIDEYKIPIQQLRATAELRLPGDDTQWLPVRFSHAASYTLVFSSNDALRLAQLRIVDNSEKRVQNCPITARGNRDLLCSWKAKDWPAGTYMLQAVDTQGVTLLNEVLRHDPRWLKP